MTKTVRQSNVRSSLATVLFTDIVGSTEKAAELGNRRWRELLQAHHTRVRQELRRFEGREANTAGDGFLATFAQPLDAIRCACAIRDAVHDLGLAIRGGLHMGQVDEVDGTVGGIAVHTGARVAAQAAADEILVSSTVRDALAGSDCRFEERGSHVLKGVPGEWRLFAVTAAPSPDGAARQSTGLRRLAGRIPRLQRKRVVVAGLVALTALLGLWGAYVASGRRPYLAPTAGPTGTTALAVLPFRVVGPDGELWREGMVDLLSTNLDGAGDIRTIDPRTVLSRWRDQIGEEEEPGTAEALRAAGDAGARYALLGSMVSLGGEVRLATRLYDAGTGELQGESMVKGPPDSIPALVDQLSIEILRTAFAEAPVSLPAFDLRRVTTTSLPALKHYLEGERKFRHARAGEAIEDFRRAEEADSTFALALHRLALAQEWTRSPHEPQPNEFGQRAASLSQRLTARDALLLRGSSEINEGKLSAIATLEELTTRYPDDAEGWFLLGDAYFHFGGWALEPPAKFRNAMKRALELDPHFGLAYVHLIEDGFWRRDSSDVRTQVARLSRIDPGGPEAVGLRLAYALAWGDERTRVAAGAELDTASAEVLLNGKHALDRVPDFSEQALRFALLLAGQERHPIGDRLNAQSGILIIHVIRGRLGKGREAYEQFASLADQDPAPPEWVHYWRKAQQLRTYLWGYPKSANAQRAAEELSSEPEPDYFLLGAYAAREGTWSEVERAIQALDSLGQAATAEGDSMAALDLEVTAGELRGYAAARRGDHPAAIRELEKADRLGRGVPGRVPYMARYELGRAYLESGRAAEARRYLESLHFEMWPVSTPIELYLGRASEELDDLEEAKLHYGRFVRAWEGCDPELRPLWEEGRQALRRLTGLQKL